MDVREDAQWPVVSVTMLAYNRRDEVRNTIRTLLDDLDYPNDRLEIIVVDNSSEDGTVEMVRREFPGVKVLDMPENLGAPALNRAFAQARGDWVMILDDDCWIDGQSLKLAVASAESAGADLVSFRVRSGIDPDYFFSEIYTTGLLAFWGCAWIVTRRALGVLTGYDPNIFIWGNEAEFMLRFLDAGFRHLYLPEVVAVHMKLPPPDIPDFRPHRVNIRHWCYTAAKLLAPADAARVIGRLLLTIIIDVFAFSPTAARTFPPALAGVIDGLRVRKAVRAEVSALYRDNFISFANPLWFLRTPAQRWLAWRGDPSRIGPDARGRFDAFREHRRRYYPALEAATLEA